MSLPFRQNTGAGVIGASDDEILTSQRLRLFDVDAVASTLGQTAIPAPPLVAVDVPAEDVEPKRLQQFELGLAMGNFGRHRAVGTLMRKPLPIVGGINKSVGTATFKHRPNRLAATLPAAWVGIFRVGQPWWLRSRKSFPAGLGYRTA